MDRHLENEIAVLFMSPGVAVDGGGFVITPTGVHPVDPWGPLLIEYLEAAQLYSQVSQATGLELATQFQATLAQYLVEKLPAVTRQIGEGGKLR